MLIRKTPKIEQKQSVDKDYKCMHTCTVEPLLLVVFYM